jgi:hypothetical protein
MSDPWILDRETMKAEGWYQDPYEVHEDRWYSDDTPTALVRDGDVESNDPPPSGAPLREPLERSIPHAPPSGPDDLRREGDGQDGQGYGQKAFDVMGGFGPVS